MDICLGIDEGTKGYRIFKLEIRKVEITHNIVVDEQQFYKSNLEITTFELASIDPLGLI